MEHPQQRLQSLKSLPDGTNLGHAACVAVYMILDIML